MPYPNYAVLDRLAWFVGELLAGRRVRTSDIAVRFAVSQRTAAEVPAVVKAWCEAAGEPDLVWFDQAGTDPARSYRLDRDRYEALLKSGKAVFF